MVAARGGGSGSANSYGPGVGIGTDDEVYAACHALKSRACVSRPVAFTRMEEKMRPFLARKLRPSPALIVATAALAVALGGVAYATIPDSGGVIHGCYQKTVGSLRVIDPSTGGQCSSAETPIHWSQGPAGVSGYQIINSTFTIHTTDFSPQPLTVSCPAGDKALSGGYNVPYIAPGFFGNVITNYESQPTADGSGWVFAFVGGPSSNPASSFNYDVTFPVYVVCAAAG
jgi:hypothetical protein